MKKIFIFIFVSFFAMPLFAADKGIGLTVGLDYAGKNMWRGLYLCDKEGVFHPYISYDIMNTGLSITAGASFVDDYILEGKKHNDTWRDSNYWELSLDYENKFGMVTLGAGAWFGRYWDKYETYSEFYVSATLEDIILSPTIVYTHDYFFYDEYYKEQAKDFYVQFGISHAFDLVSNVSLTLGAIAGYYNCKSGDVKGISDIDLSAELAVEAGAVTFTSGFHYVIVPTKDFWYTEEVNLRSKNGLKKDVSRFYATFGASYSF